LLHWRVARRQNPGSFYNNRYCSSQLHLFMALLCFFLTDMATALADANDRARLARCGGLHGSFRMEAIATLLTLIGYSVNDKVVVYDRMRENLKQRRLL
jgi:hypothetical protein